MHLRTLLAQVDANRLSNDADLLPSRDEFPHYSMLYPKLKLDV